MSVLAASLFTNSNNNQMPYSKFVSSLLLNIQYHQECNSTSNLFSKTCFSFSQRATTNYTETKVIFLVFVLNIIFFGIVGERVCLNVLRCASVKWCDRETKVKCVPVRKDRPVGRSARWVSRSRSWMMARPNRVHKWQFLVYLHVGTYIIYTCSS